MEGGVQLMSRSIDQRIVEMRFDNREFEQKSKETIETLERLKRALDLDNTAKGLENLNEVGRKFSLQGMADSLNHIASKFSALDVIAFTALQNITNTAINFGKRIFGAIVDPLVEGGKRRALNIQQAKFQFEGLGMDVEATMASALKAVEGTAYGLDEAAKVASQLGASGMRAGDDMTRSLRAVAGVAAMTNSSYEDMGNIFTTVAGNGRLMGQQLLQLSGRGINAAAAIAKHMGISEKAVRDMVSKGQISFEIFTEAMDAAFGEHAQAANKMFSGAAANLRSAFARIGADVAGPAFENLRDVLNAMRPVVNALRTQLQPLIIELNKFQKAMADKWVKTFENMDISWLGGIIQSIVNVFQALERAVTPIKDAFRDIFPPYTVDQLTAFSTGLQNLTERFKMSEETSDKLRRTFRGLFAVADILGMALIAVGKAIFGIIEFIIPVRSGIFSITASFGDFAVGVRDAIRSADIFNQILNGLSFVLTPIGNLISGLASIISTSFKTMASADSSGLNQILENIQNGFKPLVSLGDGLGKVFGVIFNIVEFLAPGFVYLGQIGLKMFKTLTDAAGGFLKSLDPVEVLKAINAGAFTVLIMSMNNVLDMFRSWLAITRKPVFEFNKMMYDVRVNLMAWQAKLQAEVLIKLATAVAILAGSLWVLSTIDPAKLLPAMTGMTSLFTQLFGSFLMFDKLSGKGGIAKLNLLSVAMINVSIAILILTQALKQVSKLDPEKMMVGLTGLAGMLTMVTTAALFMSKSSGKLIKGSMGLIAFAIAIDILAKAVIKLAGLDLVDLGKGLLGLGVVMAALAIFLRTAKFKKFGASKAAGLILLATAVNILASAVKKFGDLSVKQLIKGLGAMGIVLAQLAIFINVTGNAKKVISTATGMVILGAALNLIADAVTKLGRLSLEELGKGLLGMGMSLSMITLAMRYMPKNMLTLGGGLLIVATALVILAKALTSMGGMSLIEIGKGLVALGGSLTIIAIAMKFMQTALPGAAALLVVSAALVILTGVLKTLGGMSLLEIGTSLLVLAGTFGILGVAGLLLAPLTPVLIGLAGAMALFGLGVAALGLGLVAISTGLTAFAVSSVAIAGSITLVFSAIISLIPNLMVAIAKGIIDLINVLAEGAASIGNAVRVIALELIKTVVDITPPLIEAFFTIVVKLLQKLAESVPLMVDAGMKIILGFLRGIANNIQAVTEAAIDVVLNFIRGVNSRMPDIIDTAYKTIISFINGLADAIRNNRKALMEAGWNLVKAIIGGVSDTLKDVVKVGKDVVTNILKGIGDMGTSLWNAGLDIGKDLIRGMTKGISDFAGNVAKAAKTAAENAVNGVKKFLGIKSPSRVFQSLGVDTIQGMVNGISSMGKSVTASAKNVGKSAMDAMRAAVEDISDLIGDDLDSEPVITPLIDLDKVKKGFKEVDDMLRGPKLTPAYSTGSAGSISNRSYSAEKSKTVAQANNTSYNINVGGNYQIREEADIKKISQELALEIERKRRA